MKLCFLHQWTPFTFLPLNFLPSILTIWRTSAVWGGNDRRCQYLSLIAVVTRGIINSTSYQGNNSNHSSQSGGNQRSRKLIKNNKVQKKGTFLTKHSGTVNAVSDILTLKCSSPVGHSCYAVLVLHFSHKRLFWLNTHRPVARRKFVKAGNVQLFRAAAVASGHGEYLIQLSGYWATLWPSLLRSVIWPWVLVFIQIFQTCLPSLKSWAWCGSHLQPQVQEIPETVFPHIKRPRRESSHSSPISDIMSAWSCTSNPLYATMPSTWTTSITCLY